jgi:activator of 2-hydroxyglutaryl-CoA dehydratase
MLVLHEYRYNCAILNSRHYKSYKLQEEMDWEEDPSEDIEVYDENSASNSYHTTQLQEYKDFKRPEQNLEEHRSGKNDVYLMGIDVTSTIKTISN